MKGARPVWGEGLRKPTGKIPHGVLPLLHPSWWRPWSAWNTPARDYLLNYQVTADRLLHSLAMIQVMVRHMLRILELPFDVMHQPEALVA